MSSEETPIQLCVTIGSFTKDKYKKWVSKSGKSNIHE